jgi:hypothetical protein
MARRAAAKNGLPYVELIFVPSAFAEQGRPSGGCGGGRRTIGAAFAGDNYDDDAAAPQGRGRGGGGEEDEEGMSIDGDGNGDDDYDGDFHCVEGLDHDIFQKTEKSIRRHRNGGQSLTRHLQTLARHYAKYGFDADFALQQRFTAKMSPERLAYFIFKSHFAANHVPREIVFGAGDYAGRVVRTCDHISRSLIGQPPPSGGADAGDGDREDGDGSAESECSGDKDESIADGDDVRPVMQANIEMRQQEREAQFARSQQKKSNSKKARLSSLPAAAASSAAAASPAAPAVSPSPSQRSAAKKSGGGKVVATAHAYPVPAAYDAPFGIADAPNQCAAGHNLHPVGAGRECLCAMCGQKKTDGCGYLCAVGINNCPRNAICEECYDSYGQYGTQLALGLQQREKEACCAAGMEKSSFCGKTREAIEAAVREPYEQALKYLENFGRTNGRPLTLKDLLKLNSEAVLVPDADGGAMEWADGDLRHLSTAAKSQLVIQLQMKANTPQSVHALLLRAVGSEVALEETTKYADGLEQALGVARDMQQRVQRNRDAARTVAHHANCRPRSCVVDQVWLGPGGGAFVVHEAVPNGAANMLSEALWAEAMGADLEWYENSRCCVDDNDSDDEEGEEDDDNHGGNSKRARIG